jgi:hypothetical protein
MPPSQSGIAATIALSIGLVAGPNVVQAQQGMDDMPILPKRALDVGVAHSTDSWSRYWEGTLKRSNQNIGTLTTQTTAMMVSYGVTDRFDVTAMLPYVTTSASQGTLHEMSGVQDFSISGRYRVLKTPLTSHAALSAIVIGSAGIPASNYTPDYLPLSIGSASRRASARLLLNLQSDAWWFVNGSSGYTWRRNVRLDRSAYYTQGQLYLTNEVEMPDVADYTLSAGYRVGRLCIPLMVTQQRTLGGGDIRRQDMPFVSNRMDFVKVGGSVMYTLSVPKRVSVHAGTMRTVSGRNVGQSETFTAGVTYAVHR